MSSVENLIDKARQVCNVSRRELARQLGEDQAFLSRIENGKAPMPPALAARLANRIGEDARTATLLAVISQEKDQERRAELAALYGLDLPTTQTVSANTEDGLYIM